MALPVLARALAAVALAAAGAARATPVLGEPRAAGPLRVFPDDADAKLFFYAPGPLAVATAPEGGPDLRFLQMVYVGTAATGDPDRFVAKSVLSFRVLQQPVAPAALAAARAALPPGAVLRAVPPSRLESHLVWTPIEGDAASARDVGPARTEAVDGAPVADDGTWTERQIVITPGPADSQLLWTALQRGRLAMSFGWTHLAVGLPRGRGRLAATPGLLAAGSVEPEPPAASTEQVVGSGAIEIAADAARWPDRFRRIDLNQALPPGFLGLEVRCYDFQDALRPDLDRKLVEVRAVTVGGRAAVQAVRFGAARPPVATLRFAQAVRLDTPFRWRTVEIRRDGTTLTSAWSERADWMPLLDVTTPPEARPAPAPAQEIP